MKECLYVCGDVSKTVVRKQSESVKIDRLVHLSECVVR